MAVQIPGIATYLLSTQLSPIQLVVSFGIVCPSNVLIGSMPPNNAKAKTNSLPKSGQTMVAAHLVDLKYP